MTVPGKQSATLLQAVEAESAAHLRPDRMTSSVPPIGTPTRAVNVSLQGTTHQGGGRSLAYFEEVLGRVRRLSEVQSASATEFLPIYVTGRSGGVFVVDGKPGSASSAVIPVFSDYFRTMGGSIVADESSLPLKYKAMPGLRL